MLDEEITEKKSITEKYKFFCEHRYKSGSENTTGPPNFESYLPNITTIFQENCLTEKEFKNASFFTKDK